MAEIVNAALAARTPEEASGVNDMIALRLGARTERYIADRVSNLGLLTTAGDYDHKSLEPVTNMHDTLLERFAWQRYGDLDAVKAATPREAVSELMGHLSVKEKAELARVDIYEAEPPARQSKRVTLAYRDRGCGITNAYIPESIFYAGSRHKNAHPWMSGAFGLGATTCYPNATAVVLVTRRAPELLQAGEEDVISVAIAEWQQHAKGRGIYYLVDHSTNLPLPLPASELPDFEPGTYLAFISYVTNGFHTGRNDRTSMEFLINTRLWDAPLPVRLMNHVATGDHPKDHHGRRRQFETSRPDRKDFHGVMPFRLAGATYRIPVDVHYFEAGPSGDKGGMRNFTYRDHAAILLANGQAHKHWTGQELKHRADRLTKLYDRTLVVAYLDEIPVDLRTGDLFTPDRVDFVQTEDANRLQDQLGAFLNSWEELRELNNELVKKALESRTDGRSTFKVAEKIQSQLAFKGGFRLIGVGEGGNGDRPRKKWAEADLWPDPTTLEGPNKVSAVPGKPKFLYYFVNAEDEFFSSGRGKLELICDHNRIGEAELVAGTELYRGLARVSLLVPEDVAPGTEATILACVGGWMKASGGVGDDLQWETKLEVIEQPDGKTKPKETTKKNEGPAGGPLVALIWPKDDESPDDWHSGVPGKVEPVEAQVLAKIDEYKELAKLGDRQIPTIYLNADYTPLKKYETWRANAIGTSTRGLDEARDRYAVAAGVGLLVLYERERDRIKQGKPESEDTLTERQAVARSALAMMPDIDKLIREAGLEHE